jgi:predicted MFS family arabinose efflux permease
MIGFSFTFGLLGAIYGGKPVSLLIDTYQARHVAVGLGLISIAIGCLTYFILRAPSTTQPSQQPRFAFTHMQAFLCSPVLWVLAIANLLMVGSLEGFADVWGVPYLMLAYHLNQADAAGIVSFIFFGMLIGGPFLALCSRWLGEYPVITACGAGMALIFIVLLSCTQASAWMLASLFFVVGMMCCYQVIVFSAGMKLVTPQALGVTVAFLNCINMLGGSFFHTIIGQMMDASWAGEHNAEGVRIYSLSAYHHALTVIPSCAILGAMMVGCIGIYLKTKKT